MDFGFYSILLGAAALFVLALLLIGKLRARRRSQLEADLPLPVFFKIQPQPESHASSGFGSSNGRASARPPARPVAESLRQTPASAPSPAASFRRDTVIEPAPMSTPRSTPIITPQRGAAAAAMHIAPATSSDRAIDRAAARQNMPDEKTVVFKRHTDGPLELLPGRLEVVEGEGEGRDIRFMRAWGEPPEVTFGRARGPAHRHVQLVAPTVSRNHARMQLEGDRWKITNLSATNPVVINGEELPPQTARYLGEGDRIEMGEVIFRYRER